MFLIPTSQSLSKHSAMYDVVGIHVYTTMNLLLKRQLHLSYFLTFAIYDKGDDLDFAIINCPMLDSNIPELSLN